MISGCHTWRGLEKPFVASFRPRFRLLTGWLMIVGTGCTPYHPAPLTGEKVAAALRARSRAEVRLEAARLHHPLLPPVVFRTEDDGLSPEQAAVFAVIANPVLRSVRDARGLAGAQIIQAGILPNPQISPSLELPLVILRQVEVELWRG